MTNTGTVYYCSSVKAKTKPDIFFTGSGQRIIGIHSPDDCLGEFCCIHNPSDHPMKDFPTLWRQKSESFEVGPPLMERTCSHGIGHPDPDHIAAVRKLRGDAEADADGVHGCDGCCSRDDFPKTIEELNQSQKQTQADNNELYS